MRTITIKGQLPVKIGWLELTVPTELQTADLLQQTSIKMAQQFANTPLSEDLIVQQVRQLFRAVGIDPTKYRPSSEALLRRAIKGEPVRSINPIVDINNICSMEYRLPFGCYDADKISGDITMRLGKNDEEYTGVAKQISIGEKLCCADSIGPFGSPISDSARTRVTDTSKGILVLAFGHITTPDEHIFSALSHFSALCDSDSAGVSTPTDTRPHRGLATAQPA